jgi:hypothetical protein
MVLLAYSSLERPRRCPFAAVWLAAALVRSAGQGTPGTDAERNLLIDDPRDDRVGDAELALEAGEQEIKVLCTTASWQQVKTRDIDSVCDAIIKQIKKGELQITFEPDCKTYLNRVWDDAMEQCPHGKDTKLLSVQSVENVICSFSTVGQIEGHAYSELCDHVMKARPYFQFYPDNSKENCVTSFHAAWDGAKRKCPQGSHTSPTRHDFEKLVCAFATEKMLQFNDYAGTCSKIKESIVWIQFHHGCETSLTHVWEKAKQKCPFGADKVLSPFEIEMMMCNAARKREMEDMMTIEICSEITLTTPWLVDRLDPNCHTVFDAVWHDAVLKCPTGRDSIVDDDTYIGWACGFALAEWIQHKQIDNICDGLLFNIHWLRDRTPSCEFRLNANWDKMKGVCPYGRATPLTDDKLVFFACSFATKAQVVSRDTERVCNLMKARLPWLYFKPSCTNQVESAWPMISEKCPQGAPSEIDAVNHV